MDFSHPRKQTTCAHGVTIIHISGHLQYCMSVHDINLRIS